jgi:uncharacterized spore protein YtfJ
MIKENAPMQKGLVVPETTLVDRLAEIIGAKTGAALVYGEPVSQSGITVIPVAKVRYGFGGGFGHKQRGQDEGGGGGGVVLSPLGYIEIKNGSSTFKPIRDPATVTRMILVGSFLAFRLLRPFLRSKKR